MSTFQDSRGYVLRTLSAEAADACRCGMEGYNYWRADAMASLTQAVQADQQFALPKLATAWILHLARSTAYVDKVQGLLKSAEDCTQPGDVRELALAGALRAAAAGNGIEAATTLEAWLDKNPTDLFALRLVQFELFWSGRAAWMQDILERASDRWSSETPGYGMYLSCRAFANEEAGDYAAAERFGREAVERTPTDPWGAHAVAHVLVMQGRIDDGIEWLEGLCGNWDDVNQIKHHLWWHLSLFLLERGEHERILELLTSRIRNPESPLVKAVPDATIDLQNVASILLRLELRGVEVGDAWEQIADVCAGRIHNHANAFSNAHDMMALAATGRYGEAHELLRSMREFAGSGSGSLRGSFASAGIGICEAVLAHRRRDYPRVVEALMPVRHDLSLVGGSHAQRDIFYQILIDSAHRAGRPDLVSIFLRDVRRIGFGRVTDRSLYRDLQEAA